MRRSVNRIINTNTTDLSVDSSGISNSRTILTEKLKKGNYKLIYHSQTIPYIYIYIYTMHWKS